MTFRDDREALRARNEALEDENRALRERLESIAQAEGSCDQCALSATLVLAPLGP